jgi:hypothetical protein
MGNIKFLFARRDGIALQDMRPESGPDYSLASWSAAALRRF